MAGRSKTHIDQQSLRLLIKNVGEAKINIEAAYAVAVKAAGEKWESIAKQSLSETDHSLKDLARLDHPYARRHGVLSLHAGSMPQYMADGRDIVHTRSGVMVSALRSGFLTTDNGPTYRLWLDKSVPEVKFVLEGTKNMLPRDPLVSTALARGTQNEIMSSIVSRLSRRFGSTVRAKFVTGRRFGGGPTPRMG